MHLSLSAAPASTSAARPSRTVLRALHARGDSQLPFGPVRAVLTFPVPLPTRSTFTLPLAGLDQPSANQEVRAQIVGRLAQRRAQFDGPTLRDSCA